MKARLVPVGGDFKVRAIPLKLPLVIGRSRGATLTVPHPLVSRRHCELYEDNGRLLVRDLGSLNGTFVGPQRVQGEAELPDGELLTVATVSFRALYGGGDDDATNPPDDVDDGDRTHGFERTAESASRGQADETADVPGTTRPAGSEPLSIDRDTQWQAGTMPPRQRAQDDDDLSSLLDDMR